MTQTRNRHKAKHRSSFGFAVGLFALFVFVVLRSPCLFAQPTSNPRLPTPAPRNQERQSLDKGPAFVVDPGTGLTWAATDNGSDVSLLEAEEHCSQMGEGWALPTIRQLQTVFRAGGSKCSRNVIRGIKLTGCRLWSSDAAKAGKHEFLSFENGRHYRRSADSANRMRVLCVRSGG